MKKIVDQAWLEEKWFDDLKSGFKLAWFYIWTKSDLVGVWSANFKIADIQIGHALKWTELLTALGDKVKVLESGKWWLTQYCPFQFGTFSPESRVHLAAKRELNRHGISDLNSLWIAYPEAPRSLISQSHCQSQIPKGSGEGKQKRAKIQPDPIPVPDSLNVPLFLAQWEAWEQHRKQKKISITPMARNLQLKNLAAIGIERALAAIEHSIRNSYTGIHEPTQNRAHQPNTAGRNVGHNAAVSYANRPKRQDNGESAAA